MKYEMTTSVRSSIYVKPYLQEAFKHSGLRHLKTLSSGFVIMVAKGQNGQATRSGISAFSISSSCSLRRARENNVAGRISCRTDRGNWCSQDPVTRK